jgi:hypothetical protein
MREKIQVGIACGKASESYVDFLLRTMKKTESGEHDFEIILGLSDTSVDVDKIISKDLYEYLVIEAFDNDSSGSLGHGKCLDEIFKNMTSRIGMIVDVDVAFLAKGWDVKLLSCLDEECVIIGPEYRGDKYKGFPNVIFCMFLVSPFKDCEVSFVPAGKIKVLEGDESFYGREVGDIIHLDVGWETSYKLRKAGYSGALLPFGASVDVNGKVVSKVPPKFIEEGMRGDEYQLNGEPICTHVGRSSSRDFATNPIIKRWKEAVEKWVNI